MAGITEELREEYAAFAASAVESFRIRLRRERARQLRDLLANPDAITLETFNREVWRVNADFVLNGQRFPARDVWRPLDPERFAELNAALTAGELELHGNCLWGAGAQIFGAPLQVDDTAKLALIRQALVVLNGSGTPLEKAMGIEAVSGFGPNIATGLVMVYHPTEFQIYNEPSRAAVQEIGYPNSPLAAFEESVAQIRAELGAEDFLALDWFMYARESNIGRVDLWERLIEGLKVTVTSRSDGSVHRIHSRSGATVGEVVVGKGTTRLNLRSPPGAGAPMGVQLSGNSDRWHGGGVVVTETNLPAARELLEYVASSGDPDATDVHLIVKWSPRFNAQTDAEHIAVAEQHGAVWWGLLSKTGERSFSEAREARLREQLDAGHETYAFIVGQAGNLRCWRARVADLAFERSAVDPELVPAYYSSDWQFHLWLKLADFEEIDRDELFRLLDPDTRPGQPVALSNQTNPLFVRLRTTPRYWWVNQGASFQRAREGRFLWAPLLDKVGRPKDHWQTMRHLRPGDIVFNYANGQIRATSVTRDDATPATRPDPEADQAWSEDGLRVELDWRDLAEPVKLVDIPAEWRTDERVFAGDGSVNQGYLFPLSDGFVSKLAGRFPQLLDGDAPPPTKPPQTGWVEPPFSDIARSIASSGMTLSSNLLRRYHVSLKTRGFVVLSGVSGTGKTWLAQAYADAVGARAIVVPVAPNWTTNEDLLGYLNPLNSRYQDTAFSLFLRDAASELERAMTQGVEPLPFHLILDEMNLARVEYYFAKFLSAMELRTRSTDATIELAPSDLVQLPPNLKFVGTVNVDETTHGFADKVYDRSQLIEMTIDRAAVELHLDGRPFSELVGGIWTALAEVAPFAFRVLDEITSYVDEAARISVGWEEALDEQLLQKVLPKIKGTDLRIAPALREVKELTADRFPLTHQKASTMLATFDEHAFTSYF